MQPCVRFGPFLLDPEGTELRRGERVIPLRPKAFAILQYLVERQGHLVETAELIGAVWPDTVIEDRTLKACVSEIRSAPWTMRISPLRTSRPCGDAVIGSSRRC